MNQTMLLPLSMLRAAAPEVVLANLLNENSAMSEEAGKKLISECKKFGLSVRDYLRLAINPKLSNRKDEFEGLNGYETALSYLSLPLSDDFDAGVVLDLASDTFNTYPGTRAMFPEVIDDFLRWKYRQDTFEHIDRIVFGSRTIAGVEMLWAVVNDSAADYEAYSVIAELANIPVKSVRTTQNIVGMKKIGGGYRMSYEFSRRARLDVLTPYAARLTRELERSKVALATQTLVNGDAVQPPATVYNQSTSNGGSVGTSINGNLSYKHVMKWLVSRAKAGTPVTTVVGNWDAYVEWLLLFAAPIAGSYDRTSAQNLAEGGFRMTSIPLMNGQIDFAISSTAPAGQLIGITKEETIEELIEAGSMIAEAERAVTNQTVTYYNTQVCGFRMPYADTRQIYNYNA